MLTRDNEFRTRCKLIRVISNIINFITYAYYFKFDISIFKVKSEFRNEDIEFLRSLNLYFEKGIVRFHVIISCFLW